MKLFAACSTKYANVLKLASIGITLTLLGSVILLSDPVKLVVESQLTLRAGSLAYKLWLRPSLDVFISIYMFNITNLEEFVRGVDTKLKVAEVGPYVYQEVLTNTNVTFNANDTVTYTPRRDVHFVREKSIGDPKVDRIIAPNIPYMGATTVAAEISTVAALGFSALTKQLKSKPMLLMPVHDYLWGYDDNLVSLASKFVPSIINFDRFGLAERLFAEGDNEVTMKLPSKVKKQKQNGDDDNDLRDYALENWNGQEKIKAWANKYENATKCNSIRGSYEATLFPRNITKGETFRIYRKAFCRNLPIAYSHPGYVDGIEAYYFKLVENAFDSDLDDVNSSCFCSKGKCLKKGLANIKPCYFNMPLAVSFPHFFNADPSLLASVDGLSPNESKHGSEIIIQPQLGIPMKVHSRFQINLIIDDVKFNPEINKFRDTVIPILWLEIAIDELKPSIKMLLTLLFKVCPYVQYGVISILMVTGLALVCTSLFQCVSWPAATVIPSPIGGIIIIPKDASAVACVTIVTNGSHTGSKNLKKVQKEMKTITKKQPPPSEVTKTEDVCIVPLLVPQQPQLEHHHHHHRRRHHGEDQQQLLQNDSSRLLLPEFMT